jgi:acyl carrier protein
MHAIDSQIRSFITESLLFGDTQREIMANASFIENDIIDSTGVLELVMFVEERFGITVEDSEIVPDNFDSIEKIRSYVFSKTPEAALAGE